MAKKKVKVVKINPEECTGCLACEAICSAFHATPKYSSVNPAKSRIHVYWDPLRNIYMPVYSGPHVEAECLGRDKYVIGGKEYDECLFCRAVACPSRDLFKDPDSGLPLRCDMCEDEPPLEEPMCVQVCLVDALTYEEREEEVEEEEEKLDELEMGLEALIEKYGFDKVTDTLARISISKQG
ncbi:MAG: (4Fe-4S)-binding protein [Deltaproteobacteria bacterium]|nr:MAG: (4Fe-4S)-binding protein [Deltaproteobacteria bacterium]